MAISNQPPKGTYDWFPEEFRIRKYIFDTWRRVCIQFGGEEYLTPIVESADVYRAKSGEDVGGKELMTFFDRAGRELAIRPEMTPSVTRMVTRIYESAPKPLRYFSVANFMRNEKPQKGRNREFWQLNYDVIGTTEQGTVNADAETIQVALEIMLAFNPPANSFVIYINNRKLIDAILNDIVQVPVAIRVDTVRILDKWEKLELAEFAARLTEIGLTTSQIEMLTKFMQSKSSQDLLQNFPAVEQTVGFREIKEVFEALKSYGYGDLVEFNPSVIRGFDYYDGTIFEAFDKNPANPRAMFGGGRNDQLAQIFGSTYTSVGFAPGDETTRIFLENWGLIPAILEKTKQSIYYIPLLSADLMTQVQKLAKGLRAEGKNVEVGLEVQKMGKALDYANKKQHDYVVIMGENEIARSVYLIKNMATGDQQEFSLTN